MMGLTASEIKALQAQSLQVEDADMRRIRMECLHLGMAAVENGIASDPIAWACEFMRFVLTGTVAETVK